MTDRRSPYLWFLVAATPLLVALSGCAPVRQPAFRTPLPPAAVAAVEGIPPSAGPPPAEVAAYGNELPELLKESNGPLPEPSVLAPSLRRVDARFEAGRRFYRAGDMAAARREFDRAVETLLNAPRNDADGGTVERKLSELVDAIHGYDISGLGAGLPDSETVFDKPPLEEIPEPTFPIDPKLRNRVTEELKTTVSQLPLELNDEVLRYINFFSTGKGRKILLNGLRQAGRYRPLIYRIFDEEGMPQELIHLAQAESGFAPACRLQDEGHRDVAVHLGHAERGMGSSGRRPRTTGWTRRRPPAPPPGTCATSTSSSATGTWPWRLTTADP